MDNDKGSIMDVGCYERGCACVASDSAAGVDSECVPVVRYKPWVGLTDEEMLALIAYEPHPLANRTAIINAVERLLKEKNA